MPVEIQPNTWYTLYQVFGDSLFALDRFWAKEEEASAMLQSRLTQMKELSGCATFKGSKFTIGLDLESISLEKITETDDGEPIYFPVDRPTIADIAGVYESARSIVARTGQYAELDFMIDPALKEDMLGEFFISRRPSHLLPDGKGGMKAKAYRYQLLLKSDKGIYVSDKPAVFDGEHPLPYIVFNEWSPVNSQQNGRLYVPLEYKQAALLEIMLQEK